MSSIIMRSATGGVMDRRPSDALPAEPLASNVSAAAVLPGMQAALGMGTLMFATCFAGFLTLGLELPAGIACWAEFKH